MAFHLQRAVPLDSENTKIDSTLKKWLWSVPIEIDNIIMEKLLEINPYLCTKLSSFWYKRAMPKIWGHVDLNFNHIKSFRTDRRIGFSIADSRIQRRAWQFYNTYINPNKATLRNAACLKFIKKLEPFCMFNIGCIVNLLKQCPNVRTLCFQRWEANFIPCSNIAKYCPNIRYIYIKQSLHRYPVPSDNINHHTRVYRSKCTENH